MDSIKSMLKNLAGQVLTFDIKSKGSVLFITLDSCRYDTFEQADAPNMKGLGPLHKAMAPGNFTFSSIAAMFVGFTPGVAHLKEAFVNPKWGKIFRMVGGGRRVKKSYFTLRGENIVEGFKRKGYTTIGTGAVGWFDPETPTGRQLSKDFEHFYFPGNTYSLARQLEWIKTSLEATDRNAFVFLNIGETHVPYYFKGAPWSRFINPCIPFSDKNDRDECRRRQVVCVEYVDQIIEPLLQAFRDGTVLVCADHGDCWGEDGLWEHGIHHDKVLEVPLILKLDRQC